MNRPFDKISDAELQVMKALWEAKCPLNVSELRTKLREVNGWESSTVKTLIHRLCDKGAILQE